MSRVFSLFFVLSSLLFARENPFRPAQKEAPINSIMEDINSVEKLKGIDIPPPVESVKIKTITIEYQSVEGQKIKKVYTIEKGIDPLKNIKVSQ